MPGWGEQANGELTDPEILAVVCHERYTLGGADATADIRGGVREVVRRGLRDLRRSRSRRLQLPTLEESVDDIIPIGTAPVPGSPAGAG